MMLLLARLLLTPVLLLSFVWGALALYYRLNWPTPGMYALVGAWCLTGLAVLGVLWFRPPLQALLTGALLMALHLMWWHSLSPSNTRDWADDVARTLTGQVHGDQLQLKNLRNFNWRTNTDYDIRWEDRSYDLNGLRSVDVVTSYWGMPAIAHVIVSFGFEDGRFLAFSVEIRKEKHEVYSELGGFFKEYELSVVAADERDVLRVRSNVRDEDLYLYRLDMPQSTARTLLLSYVERANQLAQEPSFYHTLTANCTTVVFNMAQHIIGNLPIDYRLLLTGYLPSYLQDLNALQPGHDLTQLRQAGRFTDRALQADQAQDFSQRIRQGVPGWE